jgi:hypothetical protein
MNKRGRMTASMPICLRASGSNLLIHSRWTTAEHADLVGFIPMSLLEKAENFVEVRSSKMIGGSKSREHAYAVIVSTEMFLTNVLNK